MSILLNNYCRFLSFNFFIYLISSRDLKKNFNLKLIKLTSFDHLNNPLRLFISSFKAQLILSCNWWEKSTKCCDLKKNLYVFTNFGKNQLRIGITKKNFNLKLIKLTSFDYLNNPLRLFISCFKAQLILSSNWWE